MWPMVAALGATAIGSYLQYQGQRETNEANAAEAERNRQFQAQQTSAQQVFQQQMSDTAHQREVEDLKKAGLNPALSSNSGGASTPSGASASGAQASFDNPYAGFGNIVNSAMGVARGVAEIKSIEKDNQFKDAQIKKLGVDTRKGEKDAIVGDMVSDTAAAFKAWWKKNVNKLKLNSGKKLGGHSGYQLGPLM